MRRLVRWVIGFVSALAIWRVWSRRRRATDVAVEPDPADELRRKLADSRSTEPPGDAAEPAPEAPVESLEERRARVHATAQEAMDAMREDGT